MVEAMNFVRGRRRSFCTRLCVRLLKIALLAIIGVSAHAHTPHDAIDALRMSPNYENDSTLFIIVQNSLLRSGNRGASWKQLATGLDSPHLLSDISISPNYRNDATLFVSTDGSGVYKSSDRGQTWRRFNSGLRQLNIGMVLVSANQDYPRVLAAGSSRGLFISSSHDAGWQRVMSDDVQVTALVFVRGDSSTYALAGDATGGLWRSSADLTTWQRIIKLHDVGAITSLATSQSAGSGETLYLGTRKAGLLRTANAGLTFDYLSRTWADRVLDCRGRKIPEPVPDLHIRDIVSSQSQSNRAFLYATTQSAAVYVSNDDGKSWDLRSQGLSCDIQANQDSFRVPHYRDLEVGGAGRPDWFLAGFDGLFRSEDGGESWLQMETLPVGLIRAIGVSRARGEQHALAVTTYGGGAYLSLDKGQSWSIANKGLVTTRLADVEFSPDYWAKALMFTLSSERLLASRQIEKGWTASPLVYKGWRRRLGSGLERRLGFSPEYGTQLFLSDAERRYVWPMQIELSPAFEKDQTILLGLRQHGVWKSEDGGVSWNRDWDGPIDYVTALQISPGFADDGTAFAGLRGSGVYVSRDGAETWNASNTGFEFLKQVEITNSPNYVADPPLHRAIKDVLLVISPLYAEDQTVFASSAAGLFKSIDGGREWVRLDVASTLANVPVNALGISPDFANDNTLVASFKGRGLFRSTDRGATFESIGPDLLRGNFDLKHIRFSPSFSADDMIYGATNDTLLVTRDKGDSWIAIDRPVRYEDWRGSGLGPINFVGDWARETGNEYSASTQAVSGANGAYASLEFFGSRVVWHGERGPDRGEARVFIDGVEVASIDLYSKDRMVGVELLNYSDLENGPHNIVVRVANEKNPDSVGFHVSVDAIDVLHQ
jgi:hypothetical protein